MAQTCPQCQSQASDEANHCPSCGAALSAAAAPAQGAPASGPPQGSIPPPAAAPAGAGAGASTFRGAGLSGQLFQSLVSNDTTQAANTGKAIASLAAALNGKTQASASGSGGSTITIG